MSQTAPGVAPPAPAESPFTLPARHRRIGAGDPGAEEPPARLLIMLVVAFLLASPVITVLLALP